MFTGQQKLFFTLLSAIFFELPITRTFFDFPWRFALSGVDCTSHNRSFELRAQVIHAAWELCPPNVTNGPLFLNSGLPGTPQGKILVGEKTGTGNPGVNFIKL